jgi:hypothetical protein
MLNNPLYNPSILKWENQNEGVFRFVQSESVAQLWGTLKSNENMTYEKLSRAMRLVYIFIYSFIIVKFFLLLYILIKRIGKYCEKSDILKNIML